MLMRKTHFLKQWRQYAAVVLCMALSFTWLSYRDAEAAVPERLTSVTYVSDEWVINFWNTESDHLEQELAQIGGRF